MGQVPSLLSTPHPLRLLPTQEYQSTHCRPLRQQNQVTYPPRPHTPLPRWHGPLPVGGCTTSSPLVGHVAAKWTAVSVVDFDHHEWAFSDFPLAVSSKFVFRSEASFSVFPLAFSSNFIVRSAVGRVEWNMTGYEVLHALLLFYFFVDFGIKGTVLSSAGNIRLWKATPGNVWRPAGSVGAEQVKPKTENKGVDMDS